MPKPKPKRRVVPFDELGDGDAFMDHVDTPLSCALVGGAYLENALGSLLMTVMIKSADTPDNLLNKPLSILGSFAARADMSYCLGLIDTQTYNNLKTIGSIRNWFAHRHHRIGFDDPEVQRLCGELQLPTIKDQWGNPFDYIKFTTEQVQGDTPSEIFSAWSRFLVAITISGTVIKAACNGTKSLSPKSGEFSVIVGGKSVEDPSIDAPVIFVYKEYPRASNG